MASEFEKSRKILIVSDGKKGHLHQSQGVVHRIPNARSLTAEIGLSMPMYYLLLGLSLASGVALAFRGQTKGLLARALKARFREIEKFKPDMIISAGSLTHPVTYLLGRLLGAKTVICMRPATIPASRFDIVIAPRHDMERCRGENVLYTLGAPNDISEAHIFAEAVALKARAPGASERRIGLLLGGDSAFSYLDRGMAEAIQKAMRTFCIKHDFCLFAATSRRTPPEAESVMRALRDEPKICPFLLLASESPENPTPGIVGLCEVVVVTEDSVSMASEVLAGGRHAVVVEIGRKKERRKFDLFFRDLIDQGFVTYTTPVDLYQTLHDLLQRGELKNPPLDESKKVAEQVERIIFGGPSGRQD